MQLPDLSFFEILGIVLACFLCWKTVTFLYRLSKQFKAYRHYKKYLAERDAIYYRNSPPTGPSAPRGTLPPQYDHEPSIQGDPNFYKDKDARVQAMAEPQGFWTRLVQGEKMHLIREMIRIANSDEHRGYWQDRIEAQRRTEGMGQQVGDDRGR